MSHFVGVAFIPRDDDYEVNEDYSKKEQNLENKDNPTIPQKNRKIHKV